MKLLPLYILFTIGLFNILGLIRAKWLARERMRILNEDFAAFKKNGYQGDSQPRYDKIRYEWDRMFWKFWIWDINKFL